MVALRATGIGFLMITLALGQILWGLAYRWISVTNGDNGLDVATRPRAVRLFARIGDGPSTTRRLSCSCIALAAMATVRRIRRSAPACAARATSRGA